MPTQRTRKTGPPSQAALDSIVATRAAFFAAERTARSAVAAYEQAKKRYVATSAAAGVRMFWFADEAVD